MGKTWFVVRVLSFVFDDPLLFSGSCFYRSAAEYYGIIEKLYLSLKIPDLKAIKTPTITNVKEAFTSANPSLFASALYVSLDASRLKEVKVCYNLKHELTSCS